METPLNKKAIVVGFGVDIGGTILLSFLMVIVVGIIAGNTDAAISLMESSSLQVVGGILGSLCTILGGFIASTKASFRHIAHGGWVGGLVLILTIILTAWTLLGASESGEPIPSTLIILSTVSILITIPLGMLGGYLGGKYQAQKSEAPSVVTTATPQ